MTEYLVCYRGKWNIAVAGAVDGVRDDDPQTTVIRLAWFDAHSHGLICMDGEADDVRRLPS